MVVVLTEVSAGRPPPLTEPERNAMASLPTVTNSRTAWKGSPGCVSPPVRNLRTAFLMGRFSRCVPGANWCVPRCVSVRSLKRIDVFLGADWCGYWGGIISLKPALNTARFDASKSFSNTKKSTSPISRNEGSG